MLCVPRPAGETDEAYAQRLADELEQKIVELGAENVAAFVAETVVGATAGAVPPVRTYLKKIRAVCDKYGVLLILDEIMSGMGRTGYLYACDEDGVAPDLLTIAKAGAGYQPIGATLVSDRIYRTIVDGSGFFQHGHTYLGHATACAAALEVQRVIAEAARQREGARRATARIVARALRRIRISATCAAAGCSSASSRARSRQQGDVRSGAEAASRRSSAKRCSAA